MKKIFAPTFCTLLLCSLLLITLGPTIAAAQEYTRTSYYTQVIPTIDGKWTTPDEWTDGEETWIGTDVVFRTTLDSGITRWIVEFLTDTTDDSGDYWRFGFDGDQSGSDGVVFKWEITGHDDWTIYQGIGGTWAERQSTIDDSPFEYAESFSSSPTSSTPHWILEFQVPKDELGYPLGDVWNFYLEVYDNSNPEFLAWPPTDPDDPDTWGIENYSTEPIPEGLTFAVMALLTTVSMLVGYKYFIKRKETKTQ